MSVATGMQGDGRLCAICGGNGKCTHCTGGIIGERRPILALKGALQCPRVRDRFILIEYCAYEFRPASVTALSQDLASTNECDLIQQS